jgi:hypothetical protein
VHKIHTCAHPRSCQNRRLSAGFSREWPVGHRAATRSARRVPADAGLRRDGVIVKNPCQISPSRVVMWSSLQARSLCAAIVWSCWRTTGPAFDAEPKTDAGKRTVSIPPHVLPVLVEHKASWADPDRVFVGRDGRPMRGDAVRQAFNRARIAAGLPGLRFHDLRHTGQTLVAVTGATIKDLMRRLGHPSAVASYRYLNAVDGRDAEIASALSDLAAHGDAARLPKTIVIKH